jgi:hypothetical protein
MVISRCCKKGVYVNCTSEGTSFYVCCRCDNACDTIAEGRSLGGTQYDARREAEIEGAISAA